MKRTHPLWRRVDGTGRKLHAEWLGPRGWRLRHCGHPTALHQWALYNGRGAMICTGVLHAPLYSPHFGTAWDHLEDAWAFVDSPASRHYEELTEGREQTLVAFALYKGLRTRAGRELAADLEAREHARGPYR